MNSSRVLQVDRAQSFLESPRGPEFRNVANPPQIGYTISSWIYETPGNSWLE